MRIALDTNAYSDFMRGHRSLRDWLEQATEVSLPIIVLGELRAGFASGMHARKNEAILTRFLQSPRVVVHAIDEQTSHHYARIFALLRSRGKPIPTNDLWIAALCLQHGLLLATRDAHFEDVPGLARLAVSPLET